MTLAALSGAPRTVEIAGERYQIYPLTLSDLGELQAWLEGQLPDPLAIVRRHIDSCGVPMEQAKFLYAEAMREASKTRIHLSSAEAMPHLNSPSGICELLYLAIRKGRPGWTREQARDLVDGMTPAEVSRIQQISELDQVTPGPAGPEAPAAG